MLRRWLRLERPVARPSCTVYRGNLVCTISPAIMDDGASFVASRRRSTGGGRVPVSRGHAWPCPRLCHLTPPSVRNRACRSRLAFLVPPCVASPKAPRADGPAGLKPRCGGRPGGRRAGPLQTRRERGRRGEGGTWRMRLLHLKAVASRCMEGCCLCRLRLGLCLEAEWHKTRDTTWEAKKGDHRLMPSRPLSNPLCRRHPPLGWPDHALCRCRCRSGPLISRA